VLLDDWDLDLDGERPTADLKPWGRGKAPKLVQKLLFSVPAGTPPNKVLAAVKNFAREETEIGRGNRISATPVGAGVRATFVPCTVVTLG
jgi:hypothetical protein